MSCLTGKEFSGLNSSNNKVFTGDFDINGSVDILVSTEQESRVWLSNGEVGGTCH